MEPRGPRPAWAERRLPSAMDVNALLRYTVERGASDLHLKVGNVPFVRIDGQLMPGEFDVLTATDTESAAASLMSEHKKHEFAETSEADLGYTLPGVGRFRVNVFRQRGVVGLAVRRVRSEVPTFEELRLPGVMGSLADSPRGLVLVTGPTGTGKTTTIASMIGHINRHRRAHIVTIEDPIEVMHDDVLSIVQQREIGIDTDSYANALRHVIRGRRAPAFRSVLPTPGRWAPPSRRRRPARRAHPSRSNLHRPPGPSSPV